MQGDSYKTLLSKKSSSRLPYVTLAAGAVGLLTTGALGAVLGISARTANRLVHPNRAWRPQEERSFDGSLEPVVFPAADGLRIAGWFLKHPTPQGTLILLHGFGSNHLELVPLAYDLFLTDFQCLLIDLRGHGASEGTATTLGLYEKYDVMGAVEYLCTRPDVDPMHIGVWGESMGASTAILAAAEEARIRAVVADSSFATLESALDQGFRVFAQLPPRLFRKPTIWFAERFAKARVEHVKPVEVVARIAPRPVLIVHCALDSLIDVQDAYRLFQAAREPRDIWIVPNLGHAQARDHLRGEYVQRITEFYVRAFAHSAPAAPGQ
jgi:fermentation-respiration switch protein FrsA (DUF1100 family)